MSDEPALQDQPPPKTPCVFSRFFRPSGVTERKKAATDDKSLPSQYQATFQARLLQLQFDNNAAVMATNTAESTARIAILIAMAAEADARTPTDSSCTQNYQTDGSRVTRSGPQELAVTFDLFQTQHPLGRVPTTPRNTLTSPDVLAVDHDAKLTSEVFRAFVKRYGLVPHYRLGVPQEHQLQGRAR